MNEVNMPVHGGHAWPERAELARLIAAIAAFDAVEAADRTDALAWIASGAEVYRRAKPATPPKHLVVYAAIVDPSLRRIFLIEHRKAGRWLPTGGHVDPGEHPFAAAKRELREETGTGLPSLASTPFLVTVDETVGAAVERHTDVSLWYAFTASPGESFTLDPAECAGGDWFGMSSLPAIDCGPHVARFMAKLGRRQL